MTRHSDPDDVDRLLADVERTLGGPARPPARRAARSRGGGPLPVLAGAAAAGVWVLFALLPFLRAGSGAVGAFLGALLVGLWVRWRG